MSAAPANAFRLEPKDIRDYSAMRCPMHGLITLLTGPWTTLILWLIRLNGPMRFGQIKKQIPMISAKVLTDRLRMLEEAGILYREHEPTIPPKVTYGFTPRGHELDKVLDAINAIALSWTREDDTAQDSCPATPMPLERGPHGTGRRPRSGRTGKE